MKIFIFGSLNIDKVYQVNEFVKAGETIYSTDFQSFPGGKGLNQAIAAARAGGDVTFIGSVGKDGQMLKDCLIKERVSLVFLKETEGVSGHAIIQVNRTGENCIILFPGANHAMDRAYIDGVLRKMDHGDIVLLQNETNEVPYIISTAHNTGVKVVFNPSPISDELLSYPLKDIDMFILNKIEGQTLSGKDNPSDILDVLVARFPNSSFFLTIGNDGSIFRSGDESFYQAAYPSQRVDTTAAGDTYTGYLLASLAEGRKFSEAMQIASMAAAIAVSRKGASTSIPYRKEVMNNLEHLGSIKFEDRK